MTHDVHPVGLVIPAFNEAAALTSIIPAVPPFVDQIVVVSDASTDGSGDVARSLGAHVVERSVRGGPGPAIRDGIEHLLMTGARTIVVISGSGKNDPREIPSLVEPLGSGVEFSLGSRYMHGGRQTNMPRHRLVLTRVFSLLVSLAVGRRVSDGTSGMRAYDADVLRGLDLHQDWFKNYELETYILYRLIADRRRWVEVPISVNYPESGNPYTHARPWSDWWRFFRPVVLMRLGIKR